MVPISGHPMVPALPLYVRDHLKSGAIFILLGPSQIHLVANLVILHNVDSMSKAINKLKRQGIKFDDEALRSLSPYGTEHINLLGTYSLKIPKQQGNRDFKLI